MMKILNRIVLIGRLVRDPELRYTSSGTPVCNFTLAVERNYTNKQGEKEVDFIKIVTWRKLAETCAQHLEKGRLVAVEGRLQIKKNESDNRTYINPEVVAESVQFLDWGEDNSHKQSNSQQGNNTSKQSNAGNEPDDEFEIPF